MELTEHRDRIYSWLRRCLIGNASRGWIARAVRCGTSTSTAITILVTSPCRGRSCAISLDNGERLVGLLGFGAAACKSAPRDEWIGWSRAQRHRNLPGVVNNARFLMLPWVRVSSLASRLLGMAARALPGHWEGRCGYRPVLLETFVETPRFTGTCYRAAKWTCVGQTPGAGQARGPSPRAGCDQDGVGVSA